MPDRWEMALRFTRTEFTIRKISPFILVVQGLEDAEAWQLTKMPKKLYSFFKPKIFFHNFLLYKDISSAGYKIALKTRALRTNYDKMAHYIYVKDESPFQPIHTFNLEIDEFEADPFGVVVFENPNVSPKVTLVLVNVKLRQKYEEKTYAEIIKLMFSNLRIQLRDLGVRGNYYTIVAGNFATLSDTSDQVLEIQKAGFFDASNLLPANRKIPTWTNPTKYPQRRSFIFMSNGIQVLDYNVMLAKNWQRKERYEIWREAMMQGSNHLPMITKFRMMVDD